MELSKRYKNWGKELVVHILCMACVDHLYCVIFDDIGVIPFVGVRHVIAIPSTKGRFATRQRALNVVDGEEGIVYVSLHVFKRVSVAVLLRHVLIERPYFGGGALGVQVLILLHLRR